MTLLEPWALGPFELLIHAEEHYLMGDDIDRRIALISFDNAIEVAIATYLTLDPIQRNGRSYPREDVDRWLPTYHDKLNFLDDELTNRGLAWEVERSHIVYCHGHRNEQYHGGRKGTPEKNVLEIARRSALWVFSILFDAPDAEELLTQAILSQEPPNPPERDKKYDLAIDEAYGIIQIGDQSYYASELLFSVDSTAYVDIGMKLCTDQFNNEDSPYEEQQ